VTGLQVSGGMNNNATPIRSGIVVYNVQNQNAVSILAPPITAEST
jgi:hypothetical protein